MTNNMDNEELMRKHHNGKRLAGLIIVGAGAVLLCKQMGLLIPEWVLSWPMFLVVLGLYIGAKHQFRRTGWWVLVLIGIVFLMDRFVDGISIRQFFWPVLIIVFGLIMIFSKRKKRSEHWDKLMEKRKVYEAAYSQEYGQAYSQEDYIDSVAIFGGIKKNILSKDFKGGDIVCVFGGAEINLSQAEIKGHVVLEIVNIFGGTKLILPPNWEIKSEMVAILGGIEDKRFQQVNTTNGIDVLVIKGTTLFGGIEIKSF